LVSAVVFSKAYDIYYRNGEIYPFGVLEQRDVNYIELFEWIVICFLLLLDNVYNYGKFVIKICILLYLFTC